MKSVTNIGNNDYVRQSFTESSLKQNQSTISDGNLLIHRMPIKNNKVVEVNRSNNGITSACIIDLNHSEKKEIKAEYLPKELNEIKDVFKLKQYLGCVWVKERVLDNGSCAIEMTPKLLGGMKKSDSLDDLFDDMKSQVKKLNTEARGKVKDELQVAKNKFEEADQRGVGATEVSTTIFNGVVSAIRAVAETFISWLSGIWNKLTSWCTIF